MKRNTVHRVPDENPPPYQCGECWFYETKELDHGACYAIPPSVMIDEEGDMICPRTIVLAEDRGCINWKPRHSA